MEVSKGASGGVDGGEDFDSGEDAALLPDAAVSPSSRHAWVGDSDTVEGGKRASGASPGAAARTGGDPSVFARVTRGTRVLVRDAHKLESRKNKLLEDAPRAAHQVQWTWVPGVVDDVGGAERQEFTVEIDASFGGGSRLCGREALQLQCAPLGDGEETGSRRSRAAVDGFAARSSSDGAGAGVAWRCPDFVTEVTEARGETVVGVAVAPSGDGFVVDTRWTEAVAGGEEAKGDDGPAAVVNHRRRLYDLMSTEPLVKTFEGGVPGFLCPPAFSPDGRFFLTTAAQEGKDDDVAHVMELWSPSERRCIWSTRASKQSASSAETVSVAGFSSDFKALCTADGGTVSLWRMDLSAPTPAVPQVVQSHAVDGRVTALCFADDDSKLVVCSDKGTTSVWCLEDDTGGGGGVRITPWLDGGTVLQTHSGAADAVEVVHVPSTPAFLNVGWCTLSDGGLDGGLARIVVTSSARGKDDAPSVTVFVVNWRLQLAIGWRYPVVPQRSVTCVTCVDSSTPKAAHLLWLDLESRSVHRLSLAATYYTKKDMKTGKVYNEEPIPKPKQLALPSTGTSPMPAAMLIAQVKPILTNVDFMCRSNDASLVYVATTPDDDERSWVDVFHAQSGTSVLRLMRPTASRVTCMDEWGLYPMLAVGCDDGAVFVYDLETGMLALRLPGTVSVAAVSFARRGDAVHVLSAAYVDGRSRAWHFNAPDTATRRLQPDVRRHPYLNTPGVGLLPHPTLDFVLAVPPRSPGGAADEGGDGDAAVDELRLFQVLAENEYAAFGAVGGGEAQRRVPCVAFSRQGRLMAAGCSSAAPHAEHVVRLFDAFPLNAGELPTDEGALRLPGPPVSVAFSYDEESLVTVSRDPSEVIVWDALTRRVARSFEVGFEHGSPVAAEFLRDNSIVITCTTGAVLKWGTAEASAAVVVAHLDAAGAWGAREVFSAALSPDGRKLLCFATDKPSEREGGVLSAGAMYIVDVELGRVATPDFAPDVSLVNPWVEWTDEFVVEESLLGCSWTAAGQLVLVASDCFAHVFDVGAVEALAEDAPTVKLAYVGAAAPLRAPDGDTVEAFCLRAPYSAAQIACLYGEVDARACLGCSVGAAATYYRSAEAVDEDEVAAEVEKHARNVVPWALLRDEARENIPIDVCVRAQAGRADPWRGVKPESVLAQLVWESRDKGVARLEAIDARLTLLFLRTPADPSLRSPFEGCISVNMLRKNAQGLPMASVPVKCAARCIMRKVLEMLDGADIDEADVDPSQVDATRFRQEQLWRFLRASERIQHAFLGENSADRRSSAAAARRKAGAQQRGKANAAAKEEKKKKRKMRKKRGNQRRPCLAAAFPDLARQFLAHVPLIRCDAVVHPMLHVPAPKTRGNYLRTRPSFLPTDLRASMGDRADVWLSPLKLAVDERVLSTISSFSDAHTWSAPVVRYLLDAKWEEFGRAWFVRQSIAYVLFVVLFTLAASMHARGSVIENVETKEQVEEGLHVTLLVLCARYVFIECYQMSQSANMWRHFDIWNVSDILGVGGVIAFIYFAWGSAAAEVSADRAVMVGSVTTAWLWSKGLYFLRGYKGTGPFVRIIIEIVLDMRNMTMILIMCGLGFGFALYQLFPDEVEDGHTGDPINDYFNISWMLLSMFRMTLGDFDTGLFEDSNHFRIAISLFIAFAIFVLIVLLNLLIAIMGDTYGRVGEDLQTEFMRERAGLLTEAETQMRERFPLDRWLDRLLIWAGMDRTRAWLGVEEISLREWPWVHVVKFKADDADADADGEWSGTVNAVRKHVRAILLEAAARSDKLQERAAAQRREANTRLERIEREIKKRMDAMEQLLQRRPGSADALAVAGAAHGSGLMLDGIGAAGAGLGPGSVRRQPSLRTRERSGSGDSGAAGFR